MKKAAKTKISAKPAKTAAKGTKPKAAAKAPGKSETAKKPAAKKAAAVKTPAKKAAAKKAAPKTAAKKSPVKKAAAKPAKAAAAKKPVKQAAAKKTAVKTPVKKAAAKKVEAKKIAVKKPVVKKAVVKKPAEKKTAAKKLDVKKGVVKTPPSKAAGGKPKLDNARPAPAKTQKINRTAPLKPSVKTPVKDVTPAPVIVPRKKVPTTNVTILPPDYDLQKDKGEFMNPVMAEYFRQKLIRWREELLRESTETIQVTLQGTELQKPDLADRASAETDHALELRTRDRERKLIAKINEALLRIEDGTYGYCEETGEPIAVARLDARPTATLSIEAQERHERLERTHRDE